MKCIALIATLVVAAFAEPEPCYGFGGYGLPVSGYASHPFGVVSRRAYTASAPIVAQTPIVKTVAPSVPVAAPVAYASTATLKAVPVAPSTSQHHKQDEFGNYEYGYDNVNSAKIERGNAHTGVLTGSYTI